MHGSQKRPHDNYKAKKRSILTKKDKDMPAWQPVQPPPRGERDIAKLREFYAYILTPGFSLAFHSATLNRSLASIATYRAKALQAAQNDPTIMDLVTANVVAIGPEQGLAMAQARGGSQLPYWSRLAILEWAKRGAGRAEIAAAFRCSVGTVAGVLSGRGQSYHLSGQRRLTPAQAAPPGQWRKSRRGS